VNEPKRSVSTCSHLTSGDMGLKALFCESADGSKGEVSFLPIVAWVTLTEFGDEAPETAATWSWQPVVSFEHELRLDRTVPYYRGTVAKDVIGKVALGLVKSRFVSEREVRRSHSPIWNANTTGF